MKKKTINILALIIPIIIIIFCLILNNYYPFGDKPLLMIDGIKQYPGYLSILMDILHGKANLFYSFKGILGFNLFPNLVYYVFNLSNLISIFFKNTNIINFYSLMIILKFGLLSFTMSVLLNYYKPRKINIIFSLCYALTAYNLYYYNNFMWFDSIIYFPLVILGIEKMFKEKKYLTYFVFLTLSILSNFYIGYMICLFSLIYFIYKYINYHKDLNLIRNFIIYSFLSGLICTFAIYPCFLELLKGKANLFNNYTNSYLNFDLDFLNIFYKFSIGSYSNDDLEFGSPNIYVSLFVIFNVFLYFFNKKIKKKEKITSLIIILFFTLSMSFNFLDYFWQMMQKPIWYPVRYGFIIDLFLILIAYQNYNTLDINKKKYLISFSLFLLLMIGGFFSAGAFSDKLNLNAKLIYFGISLLLLIYYLFMMQNKDFVKYVWIIVLIELTANSFITFKNFQNVNSVSEFNSNLANNIAAINKIDDSSFYRMTFQNKTIKNNGLLANYNDLNYFSSIRNYKTFNLLHNYLGIHTVDDCNLTYYYNNPIINALFSIKYYVSDTIYENKDVTSLGFMTNNNLLNLKNNNNYVTNINELVKSINNNDNNIIEEISITDKNISCNDIYCLYNYDQATEKAYLKYQNNKTKQGYYFIDNEYPYKSDLTKYDIKINDTTISDNIYTPFLTNVKDKIEISIYPNGDEFKDYDYHLYFIKYEVYQEFIANINKNKLAIDYKNDNHLKGSIDVKRDTLLFTTIPNDDGWEVYVDGIKSSITPVLDSLIGINLKEGKHTIEFIYHTPGLKTGLIISISSLATAIIYIIYSRKNYLK